MTWTAETPYPLGRKENHKAENRLYRVTTPLVTHRPVLHKIGGPVLSQGNVGMCVGATGAAAKNAAPLHVRYRRFKRIETALNWYTRATAIDPFEGQMPWQDTGTDMDSVAHIMREDGAIIRWEHCFTFEEFLASLQRQVVCIGIDWHSSMYYPDAEGVLHPNGNVDGGHELLVRGDDPDKERVRIRNSWSDAWGLRGDCYLSYSDMRDLLAAEGDATVLM